MRYERYSHFCLVNLVADFEKKEKYRQRNEEDLQRTENNRLCNRRIRIPSRTEDSPLRLFRPLLGENLWLSPFVPSNLPLDRRRNDRDFYLPLKLSLTRRAEVAPDSKSPINKVRLKRRKRKEINFHCLPIYSPESKNPSKHKISGHFDSSAFPPKKAKKKLVGETKKNSDLIASMRLPGQLSSLGDHLGDRLGDRTGRWLVDAQAQVRLQLFHLLEMLSILLQIRLAVNRLN